MPTAPLAIPVAVRRHPGIHGRLLRDDPLARESLDDYRAGGGYARTDPGQLLESIERAGLRGRGGAAFPTATKLAAVRQRPADERHVVANGEEGEPASWKDRYLLRVRPHLVLDGLWQSAAIVGATRAHVYVSDQEAADAVAAALDELGEPPLPTRLHVVEPSYVAGEETAVVRAIDGGPAKPTAKPPRPFEAGVGGHPTLVQNVETLAHVALIASHGDAAHRAHGTERSTGTALFTVSGTDRAPTLVEAPLGVSLDALLETAGGDGSPSAVVMGGFFGGLLPVGGVDLTLSYERLTELGSGLGCAAIVTLGRDDCPLAVATEVMGYFAAENAGQCGVCFKGTAAMRDALARLAAGAPEPEDLARLDRWSTTLPGRGACATIDAACKLVRTLLDGFAATIGEHARGSCPVCASATPPPPRTRFAIETCTEE